MDINLIDDAMKAAKTMGGSSFPSADTTRWALQCLAEKLVSQFKNAPVAQFIENNGHAADFVERLCGLKQ